MPCSPENQSTLVARKKRIRSTSVCVWLSPDEQSKIRECMADVGIRNLLAYMRKMVLNGYVLHVDLAPVKEIVSLQRRCANNLNQIAVRVNTYGGVYSEEIKVLQKDYADLWEPISELLEKLSFPGCGVRENSDG
ncbi:plasmid mobilization relaxosome protein MobC [Clostridiaceae bacterium]|nr:plasmid mobilization relaxosome protein MobC [Clostridiaceae bacterium]